MATLKRRVNLTKHNFGMKIIKQWLNIKNWQRYAFLILSLVLLLGVGKCSAETNFQKAYSHLIENEGGWNNDPTDKGKETYMGISRKHNPDWFGWQYVDEVKGKKRYDNIPKANFW